MNSSLRISTIEERPFKCDVPATDKLIAVSKVSVQTLIWFLVLLCHYEICISLTLHYDYQIRGLMSQEFTCLVRNHHTFPLLYCLKIMLIHGEGITVHPPCLWSRFLSPASHMQQHSIARLTPTSQALWGVAWRLLGTTSQRCGCPREHLCQLLPMRNCTNSSDPRLSFTLLGLSRFCYLKKAHADMLSVHLAVTLIFLSWQLAPVLH